MRMPRRHRASLSISASCIAVLTLCSASAQAQSAITLYGVLDQGIDFTNNAGGQRTYKMQSADISGERWGLKGTEDLGGGLSAIFTLESGFDSTNGTAKQGGRMFGRQAFVGLSDKRLGTVTFGRQYDSLVDFVSGLTAGGNWAGGTASHPYDNDNTGNSFRIDNAVKYTSPSFDGLTFTGTYAFSNQTTGFSDNREYSIGAQYLRGPLTVAAAFVNVNRPGMNMQGALASDSTNFVASHQRIWGGGVNYQINLVTLGLVYTHSDVNRPEGAAYATAAGQSVDSMKFDNVEINARYQMTPAFSTGLAYTYTQASVARDGDKPSPKWHQLSGIADYNLSKRTDVYALLGYQRRAGDATGTSLDTALINGVAAGPSSNRGQVVGRVGVRHLF